MISRIDLKHINIMMNYVSNEEELKNEAILVKNIRYIKSPLDGVIHYIKITNNTNTNYTISVTDFVNNFLKPYLVSLGMVITMNDNLKYNIKLKDNEILYKSSINRDNDTYAVKEKALIRLAVKALDLH